MTDTTTNDPKNHEYWHGWINRAIRHYFYMTKGMEVVNTFRNLFYIVIGLYIVFKVHNHAWLFGAFLLSMPILDVLGWMQVHHLGKVLDWLNIRFSTHYSLASFKLQQEIRDAVTKIAEREK